MKIINANALQAYKGAAVGSRVLYDLPFNEGLFTAVKDHDPSVDRVAGQHFIVLPEELYDTVSAGDGRRTDNPNDYVVRSHRGEVGLFLKRLQAGATNFLAVVVYTIEAYIADPDVIADADELVRVIRAKWHDHGTSHVLVAVIASSAPQAPLTPYRLVKNLAGGNNEALVWSADEIREKARASATYWDEWCVVAD